MPNHLHSLVKTIIRSLPIEDPHAQQRQQGRVINLHSIDHTKPLSPADHVSPQSIIKEQVREDIAPPPMVCSSLILPLLADSMKGVLGDL